MSFEQIRDTAFVILLTIVAGFIDAQGVVHAAKIWREDGLDWRELGLSALGFGGGVALYWVVVRFLKELGIISPEVQTAIWFGIVAVGVALASGAFFKWKLADQAVALAVLVGIIWLSVRTGT